MNFVAQPGEPQWRMRLRGRDCQSISTSSRTWLRSRKRYRSRSLGDGRTGCGTGCGRSRNDCGGNRDRNRRYCRNRSWERRRKSGRHRSEQRRSGRRSRSRCPCHSPCRSRSRNDCGDGRTGCGRSRSCCRSRKRSCRSRKRCRSRNRHTRRPSSAGTRTHSPGRTDRTNRPRSRRPTHGSSSETPNKPEHLGRRKRKQSCRRNRRPRVALAQCGSRNWDFQRRSACPPWRCWLNLRCAIVASDCPALLSGKVVWLFANLPGRLGEACGACRHCGVGCRSWEQRRQPSGHFHPQRARTRMFRLNEWDPFVCCIVTWNLGSQLLKEHWYRLEVASGFVVPIRNYLHASGQK